jgi:hypothetical protein
MAFPATLSNVIDGPPGTGDIIYAHHLNNVEAKIGVDNSSNSASLDYLLRHSNSYEPGHKHGVLYESGDLVNPVIAVSAGIVAIAQGYNLGIGVADPLAIVHIQSGTIFAIRGEAGSGGAGWGFFYGGPPPTTQAGVCGIFGTPLEFGMGSLVDISTKIYQNNVAQITIASGGVATFAQIPVGPGSNPTTANQLTRKAYVDTMTPLATYQSTSSIDPGHKHSGLFAPANPSIQAVYVYQGAPPVGPAYVGIRTPYPDYPLEVHTADPTDGDTIKIHNQITGSDCSSILFSARPDAPDYDPKLLARIKAKNEATDKSTLIFQTRVEATGVLTEALRLNQAQIATFAQIPVGPASDPTTANQLARKAYVDTMTPLATYQSTSSIDPGHKHSKLWASDGDPEAVSVDASGNITLNYNTAIKNITSIYNNIAADTPLLNIRNSNTETAYGTGIVLQSMVSGEPSWVSRDLVRLLGLISSEKGIFTLETYGTSGLIEALRVDSSQNSLFNNGGVGVNTGVMAPATRLQVAESVTSSPRGIMSSQHNSGTDGAQLHLRKSRGSLGSPSVIVTGDKLGSLVASGYDGSNYLEMACIIFDTMGTIGTNRVPTNITFWTATNAAPSVLTQAVKIDSSQNVGINTQNPAFKLDVNGEIGNGSGTLTIRSNTGLIVLKGQISIATEVGKQSAALQVPLIYGNNNLSIITYSNAHITLMPNGTGKVGIKTNSPTHLLSLVGDGWLQSIKSSTSGVILGMLIDNQAYQTYWGMEGGTPGAAFTGSLANAAFLGVWQNTYLQLFTNANRAVTINGSGFVGILCTPCYPLHVIGDAYFTADVSALTFTDRTSFFEGDALAAILAIRGKAGKDKGLIDHATLPEFARRSLITKSLDDNGEEIVTEEPGRDLGAMLSILTKAIQQQQAQIMALQAHFKLKEGK